MTVALERAQNGLMEDPNDVSCATFLVEEGKKKGTWQAAFLHSKHLMGNCLDYSGLNQLVRTVSVAALAALLPHVAGGSGEDEEEADDEDGVVAGEAADVAQKQDGHACIDERQAEKFFQFFHRFQVVCVPFLFRFGVVSR